MIPQERARQNDRKGKGKEYMGKKVRGERVRSEDEGTSREELVMEGQWMAKEIKNDDRKKNKRGNYLAILVHVPIVQLMWSQKDGLLSAVKQNLD